MQICFVSTHAQNFIERPRLDDDNLFSPSDRQNLVNMIMEYITDEIVQEHIDRFPDIHDDEPFFTFHREFIRGLEDFIATKPGGSKFVPLPTWRGSFEVPSGFNVVKRKNDGKPWNEDFPDTLARAFGLASEVPDTFLLPGVCNFPAVDTLWNHMSNWHSLVHNNLGGVMAGGASPAAPIFWPFHAFLVEIYDKWKTCPNVAVIDFTFDPDSLTLASGTNVRFIFQTANHTVKTTSAVEADPITINNGGGDSDAVPQGQIREVTINGSSGGEIQYQCGIHGASMSGKIHISQPVNAISVIDFAFEPNELSVPNGTKVTFEFEDPFHTVKTTSAVEADPITINDGGGDTDAVPQGQIREVTINGSSGGEIQYQCGIHGASMRGIIRIS